MTRNIVIWVGVVAILPWLLELPARAEKCSAKELEQLAPAAVTDEVGFKQVLSPGLHFVWGIDRFALGAGVSLSPGCGK